MVAMSNLKKQLAGIKQQLIMSSAETVARFRKVETDMAELRQAAEEQAKVQLTAIESLIDLVVEHTQEAASKAELEASKAELEAQLKGLVHRVTLLEQQSRPPAA